VRFSIYESTWVLPVRTSIVKKSFAVLDAERDWLSLAAGYRELFETLYKLVKHF